MKTESMMENEFEQEFLISEVTEELYLAMQEKSLRQADFARLLGKSEAWVSQLFAGSQNLSLRTIADLFAALDCRLSVKRSNLASGHLSWFMGNCNAKWNVEAADVSEALSACQADPARLAS